MANLSLRIVDTDYYFDIPTKEFDPCFSEFRQCQVSKVPIIRIFGSTPKGQKTCLHVHNVFPYFYVRVPDNVEDAVKFSKHLALGLDSAINIALGKAASKQQQYVYMVEVVQRIPFYGYYDDCKNFYKISMYNPRFVNRVSEMLLNGAVLNQIFQPYETHIPFILQFFIDYNLHGMNLINLSSVRFRAPLPKGDAAGNLNVSIRSPTRSFLGSPVYSQTNYDIFNDVTVPSWLVIDDVAKQTTCLLEVDASAKDIMNQNSLKDNIGSNPGLNALWEDEKLRRRLNNETSTIEFPESQERTRYALTSLEERNLQQLKVVIEDRQKRVNESSPHEQTDLQSQLESGESRQKTSNETSSQDQLSSSIDQSLIDILVDMAEDNTNTPLSETTLIHNGLEEDENTEDDEEVESLIMSQVAHHENELFTKQECRTPMITINPGDESNGNNNELLNDNSWSGTVIDQVPQIDGQSDYTRCGFYVKQKSSNSTETNITCPCGVYSKDICTNRKMNVNFSSVKNGRNVIPQIDGSFDVGNSDSSSDDFCVTSRKKINKAYSQRKSRQSLRGPKLSTNRNENTSQDLTESPSSSCMCEHLKVTVESLPVGLHPKTKRKQELPSTNLQSISRKVYPKRTRSLPAYAFKNQYYSDYTSSKVKRKKISSRATELTNEQKFGLKEFKVIIHDFMKDRNERSFRDAVTDEDSNGEIISHSKIDSTNFYHDSLSKLAFNSPTETKEKASLSHITPTSPTVLQEEDENIIICESPLDEIAEAGINQYFVFDNLQSFNTSDHSVVDFNILPLCDLTLPLDKSSSNKLRSSINPCGSQDKIYIETEPMQIETEEVSDMSVDLLSPLMIESTSPSPMQHSEEKNSSNTDENFSEHLSDTDSHASKQQHVKMDTADSITVTITPKTQPPSRKEVIDSLASYNIPEVQYQGAFFSKEEDSSVMSGVFHTDNLATTKTKVKQLPDCHTNISSSGSLKSFQKAQLSGFDVVDITGNDVTNIVSDFTNFIYGDQQVVITPCNLAPNPSFIRSELEANKQNNDSYAESEIKIETERRNSKQQVDEINKETTSSTKNTIDNLQAVVKKKNISLFSPIKFITLPSTSTTRTEGLSTSLLSHSTPGLSNKYLKKTSKFTSVVDNARQITPIPVAEYKQTKKEKRKTRVELIFKPAERLNLSDIEGVTPDNSYGFDITNQNTKDAKALHVNQHLTIISMELHITTRRDLKPDPAIDSIAAIFYFIHDDSALQEKDQTGVFILERNDVSAQRANQHNLLERTGFVSFPLHCFQNEADMLNKFALFIQEKDPDIIMGYEVQMLSWGYLIERAATLDINMTQRLSRVHEKEKSLPVPENSERENWFGQLVTTTITGRIILNCWRVMRSEVTLQQYTFENVAYHVLHLRFPHYSFRCLSDWWTSDHHRWRACQHYMGRCKGNYDMLDQIDFINRTSELARVFGISFYSVISRGTQFRVESMMLRTAKPLNYVPVSPNVHQRAKMSAPECIALVMEPESRFYVDPIIVLDFQSLYPSIIIAYNYCYSTCLGKIQSFSQNEEYTFGATSLKLPLPILKDLVNNGQLHVSPNGVGFVTSEVRRGVLPRMLEEILNTRVMVKSALKKAKDDKILYKMLDSRQLGLKLIANVTYGYTSANYSGRMPCVEIADSVVRKARETLERAIHLVNSTEKWRAKVVYGDTDSLFVLMKGATKERAFAVAKEIIDEVTALNPKPVKLKFEKVYQPCFLVTKKRYVGYMYESLEQKEPQFDAKGIETIRRDNCPAVGKIMEKSIKLLFENKDVSLVKSYVQAQFKKIMEGKVTLKDFTFAKEYRGMNHYRPGACVPALSIARKALKYDRRSEPRNGERVPYVIVHGSPGLPLIQLVRTPQEVVKNANLRLNGLYYVIKQICPSLNRIFSLVGVDVNKWYTELPRITRVQDSELQQANNKKGTISQYFKSSHCPVCEQLTTRGLCTRCRDNPQETVIILSSRIMATERRLNNLTQLCQHCTGTRDFDTGCTSLDCPVFYKLSNVKGDVKRSETLRALQDELHW